MSAVSRIVRKSQATLFWCMRGLPKVKREAIYTLYAFINHLDSLVESPLPLEAKEDLIKAWQIELDNIYDKKVPVTVIGRKIYKNCMRFKIKKEDFKHILESVLMDFPQPLQAPSKKVFETYCYKTAVIPVYIMLLIMGEMKEAPMRTLALNFGKAMEITNILRNIKDDALKGHLYIPKELLENAGIFSSNPMSVITDKNLTIAREMLAKEADICFAKAHKIISASNKKTTRPLRFIFHIYKRYFDIMMTRGLEVMSPKPQIKQMDKIVIAINTLFDKA
ncbi:MAG: squalene/phytoene synthase family protein [Alphaproteobacteria bacterium]|nr:squalene/phytoene synthase family protein [Alphaproteobacteria bacterium]